MTMKFKNLFLYKIFLVFFLYLVNKHNTLLYCVPYQHFTNSIENYFSMMKSTHKELKTNIDKVVKEIPKEKYENIIKGTYNRTEKYQKIINK